MFEKNINQCKCTDTLEQQYQPSSANGLIRWSNNINSSVQIKLRDLHRASGLIVQCKSVILSVQIDVLHRASC